MIYIKKEGTLVNDEINEKEVRVISEQGEMLGLMSSEKALELAYEKDLDLVMVTANSKPPVCKIMNYGKYKFEIAKREREAKKKQKVIELKEIRISPTIEEHDLNFKIKNARKFLESGNKLKLSVKFRGRELNYTKIGEDLLNKFTSALEECGTIEKPAKLEGKSMILIMGPKNN